MSPKTVKNAVEEMTDSAKKARDYSIGKMDTILDLSHDLFLAGIGSISLAQEEIEKLVKKLIEKGQVKEEDGKQYVKDLINKTKKTRKNLEESVEEKIQKKLPTLELPSRKVFNELTKKVDTIAGQIDKILSEIPEAGTERKKRTVSTAKTTKAAKPKPVVKKTKAAAPKAQKATGAKLKMVKKED